MPDKEIQYKTSDILSLYGLSNKGLFYYEDKGLINPRRTSGGNYRVYSLQETARLHECRLFRGFGFSVEESVALVAHATPEELEQSYAQRRKDILYDIQWSQLIIEYLDRDAAAIRQIREGRTEYEITARPPMLRIPLRDVWSPYTQQSEESYLRWQSYLPIANASLMYGDLEGGAEELPINLGFIMDADVPARLGIEPPKDAVLLEGARCLHAVISGRNDILNLRSRIQPVLDYMEEQRIERAGPPVTRMIASMDAGEGMKRYDHLWVPVR